MEPDASAPARRAVEPLRPNRPRRCRHGAESGHGGEPDLGSPGREAGANQLGFPGGNGRSRGHSPARDRDGIAGRVHQGVRRRRSHPQRANARRLVRHGDRDLRRRGRGEHRPQSRRPCRALRLRSGGGPDPAGGSAGFGAVLQSGSRRPGPASRADRGPSPALPSAGRDEWKDDFSIAVVDRYDLLFAREPQPEDWEDVAGVPTDPRGEGRLSQRRNRRTGRMSRGSGCGSSTGRFGMRWS